MIFRLSEFLGVVELFCLVVGTLDKKLPSESSLRTKRVIGGIPILSRTSGYNAIRYYVWISNGQECSFIGPEWLSWVFNKAKVTRFHYGFLGFRCAPDYSNLRCGGALLTPKIVQTACHCLAFFQWSSNREQPRRAVLEKQYEGQFKVHLGINKVEDFTIGMPTSKHFVHQKCSEHSKSPDLIVWDYGWIVLQFPVDNWGDFPEHWIDFAPQYARDELIKIWDHNLKSQPACLIVGFGGYKRVHLETGGEVTNDKSKKSIQIISSELRHGWVHQTSWMECKNLTDWFDPRYVLQYTEDATWGCGLPFTKEVIHLGGGDSGSPVSCDNHYVGICHTSKPTVSKLFGKTVETATFAALRFALLENAIEYRKKFIEHANHYKEFTDGGKNQPYIPFLHYRPGRRWAMKMSDEVSKSSGSSATNSHIVLCIWLLFTPT